MFEDDFFKDAFNAVSGTEFDEIPVDVKTFVTSPDFLGLKGLSEHQYALVKSMSQIYRLDTLVAIYGEEKGRARYNETYREIVMQLGKGSGKDYTSTIAVAYVAYLCLCLKNPTEYFENDTIDIINIAINADQAQRVFFKNLADKIKKCPWFDGKYIEGRDSIQFDKNVNVYSGHSEREAYEGYNTMIIILDEISGFALENTSGNQRAKTSSEIYKWARRSVTSRFSKTGKVVMLSFPRFKNDWIQQKYDDVVKEKETIQRQAKIKLEPDLPDGYEGNEMIVEWDEDHIIRYATPGVFALKRPSWEVNPTKDLQEDYAIEFFSDAPDALGGYACMPSDNVEMTFFKNKEAIDNAFVEMNGVDEHGTFLVNFQPKEDTDYYIHVDLSKVHDRCAVTMAHVHKWVNIKVGEYYDEVHPVVKVDVVRWWKPSKAKPMDYQDVINFILGLRRRGFKLKLVTFDQWGSHDTMNLLNSQGIKTDLLSLKTSHYDDFLSVMYDGRLIGPKVEALIDELKQLQYVKDKVDHPRSGYKDLSDSVCGAIYNAITYTKKPVNETIEVLSYADLAKKNVEKQQRQDGEVTLSKGPIKAPPANIPQDVREYLESMRVI